MCIHNANEKCQMCQEKDAVESLLSISQASNDVPGLQQSHCGVMTPPPSVAGSMSPVYSDSESLAPSEDSCQSFSLGHDKPNPLKRKSKLAEVSLCNK